MKRILTLLPLLLPLSAGAQVTTATVTPPTSIPALLTGSLSGTDSFFVLESDAHVHVATEAQTLAAMQSGLVATSSINSTALTALGDAPNASGGILTFGAIGTNVEAYNARLSGIAGLSNPSGSYALASTSGGTLYWQPVQPPMTIVTASGTNVYTASPSPALSSYPTGLTVLATFTNANTGGASLNLNSLGAVPILLNGAALPAGTITAAAVVTLIYDGTNFNMVTATPTAAYTLPVASTGTLGGIKPDGSTITVNPSTGVASASLSYTLPIAATGTLGGIKPDGTTISVNPSTGVASAVTYAAFSIKTSGFTAAVGGIYGVDSTSGSIPVALPPSPSGGDWFIVFDISKKWATNQVVVGTSGANFVDHANPTATAGPYDLNAVPYSGQGMIRFVWNATLSAWSVN